MLMRAKVDYFQVEGHHREIDRRLQNWARWLYSGGGGGARGVFALVQSAPDPADRGGPALVDGADAAVMQRAVVALPEKHRHAINWAYAKCGNPRREAQRLAVSLEGLGLLVRDARQMLLNRKA